MKNVCIVGYGAIGPLHANALTKAQNAALYAVCDINPEKIRLCQQDYDVKGYTDFYEMLEDTNIDSVHICTPHYLHYEMITAAMKAGKSVVCEKPVVMTKDDFDKLIHTEGSDKVCLVFQNRLNPCVQKLKSVIDKQELGKVICAKGIVTWHRSAEYYAQDAWRGKWSTEGGGVLINQSIHTLDMLQYLVGHISSLRANMTNYSLENVIEVEDTLSAYLKFENGATGIFFATNAYKADPSPDIEIVCEQGVARYTNGKLYINDEFICEDRKIVGEKAYWGAGHESLICNYYDFDTYFTISDAYNTMCSLFAIYESAQKNQWQNV